ncbi:nucleoside-diphosphate sugar epimerase/dehydratase [Aliidiomarina sp. B3213]|uniref:polysaccharide biosynthesis protein n=1 Tax=Aliidiomarina sp. B3213 TaxID=2249757 RepID=UPI001FB30FEC|nr:nucleoside-diphosphate sugar epimerase/dehydratase [Aliidiomarina sp. B3213]
MSIDIWALTFSYVFALSVRYETFYIPSGNELYALGLAIPVSLLLFVKFGLYRAIVRYLALSALLVITLGVLTSALVLEAAIWVLGTNIPFSVVINYGLMSLVLVGGLRLLMRAMYEQRVSREKEPVIIYGAGSAGRQLAQALTNGSEFHPTCFVDDDSTLHGSSMMGLRVRNPDKMQHWINRYKAKHVLLACPSATRSRRKEILEQLESYRITVQSIPGMSEMVNGQMKIDELQDVRIEDLLGRDPVPPNRKLLDLDIRDKVVMVTGAGGSIGSELSRQILQTQPKVLILFEMAEFNLYAIERELVSINSCEELGVKIVPMLGSVCNRERLTSLMTNYQVDTVYHAAAYKHVPLVEFNVEEGVRNNILGTLCTAEAALKSGVSNFVLISTDKAVRPTNVMGATKRFAELVLQGLAKRQEAEGTPRMRISMVRFGNVLGSSGSVVPLFRKQIEAGGPVTVTDPEITRYFMTIPEAAQLVIQAGAMGSLHAKKTNDAGGNVYVLDMGEPVKIDHLARKLIRLMGLEVKNLENPHGDIEIHYSGLRPGEKLYEELLIGDEVVPTDHERIMGAKELALSWLEVSNFIEELQRKLVEQDTQGIHELLVRAPLAFEPVTGVSDLLWNVNGNDNTSIVENIKKKGVDARGIA